MFEVRILEARDVNLQALADVVNAAFATYPLMRGDRTSPEGLLEEAGPNGRFLVIDDDEGLLACAMIRGVLAEFDSAPGYEPPTTGLYFGLAGVRPASMRSGAGRALVTAAEAEAQRTGHTHVVLTTLREFDLVPYYERHGYVPVCHEDFPPGHWELPAPHRVVHFEKPIVPRFRFAAPGEAPAIADLVNAAYRVEDFFKIGDRTDAAEVAAIIGRDRFLVADGPNGSLAGALYISIADRRGHFGMLSVRPENQGTGLGRELVETAEEFARRAGCEAMELEYVNLRLELPAFYRRLGYAESGTAPWPLDQLHRISQPVHFVLMSKPLRVAAEPALGGTR